MKTLGIDIGYSNLKLAFGNKATDAVPTTKILPAGAAEASLMQHQLIGAVNDESLLVNINGKSWVAGVEPYRLQGWDRELHPDYPSTDTYKALFYAALLLAGMDEVDQVVTGLPVNQFKNGDLTNALIERMQGVHQITPKRSVKVKKAMVVPQPAGAYMDSLISFSENPIISQAANEGKMVVIDPGFFSVDWVVLQNGEVRYRSSGTSLKAMSMLLEEMQRLIKLDYGTAPHINELESYIRKNKLIILLYGQQLDLSKYLAEAAKTISVHALTPMRTTMREDGLAVDVVLLTGGGAEYYIDAAKEIFPRSLVEVSNQSALANARGFYYLGA